MKSIDLNCDLGESFGVYKLGTDKDIIPIISSCNIACGFHASDPVTMKRTVELAANAGIAIGAHPGFPDLLGFGRRTLAVSPEEAADYIIYQIGALNAFVKSMGLTLQHVKPHGALYNMAAKDYKLSLAMAKAVQKLNPQLIFMALAGSETVKACRDIGLPVAQEIFADRNYQADGTLVPRSKENAVITDETLVEKRLLRMVLENKVTAGNGIDIPITPDSVCVHGDNANALKVVMTLRESLEKHGVKIEPLKKA